MNELKGMRSNPPAVNLFANPLSFSMSMRLSLHNQVPRNIFFLGSLVFTLCLHFYSTQPSKKTFGLSSEFWKDICIVDSLFTFAVKIIRDNSFPNAPITEHLHNINYKRINIAYAPLIDPNIFLELMWCHANVQKSHVCIFSKYSQHDTNIDFIFIYLF